MSVPLYTCGYFCKRTHTNTHTHTHAHRHTHAHTCASSFNAMCPSICDSRFVSLSSSEICVYCFYVEVFIQVYVYIYIYICITHTLRMHMCIYVLLWVRLPQASFDHTSYMTGMKWFYLTSLISCAGVYLIRLY